MENDLTSPEANKEEASKPLENLPVTPLTISEAPVKEPIPDLSLFLKQLEYDADGYIKDTCIQLSEYWAVKKLETEKTKQLAKSVGFRILEEQRTICLPRQFFETGDIVGGIILLIAKKLNYRLVTFDSDLNFNTLKDSDDSLIGLLLALKSPVKTGFNESKYGSALFSAFGMSLRFRSWVEKRNLNGALRSNNYFFGNNPGQTVRVQNKEVPVNYATKQRISALFESAEVGSMFYTIYNHCCKVVDLSDCPETEDFFIHKNFITFDEVLKLGWIPVYSEKNKKKVLETNRRGTWPQRSPLFSKEEFRVITYSTEVFFESLAAIRDSYYETLLAHGFEYIEKQVRRKYALRHELLAKFAACSTRRLQELRALKNDNKLKKKDCKPADLKQLLSARATPLQTFVDELKSIVKSDLMPTALSHLSIRLGLNIPINGVIDQVICIINSHYLDAKIYDDKKFKVDIKRIEIDNRFIETVERASKLVTSASNQLKVIHYNVDKLVAQQTPESRGYFRLKLESVLKNFADNCLEIEQLKSNEIVNRVLTQYFGKTVDIATILKVPQATRVLLDITQKGPHTTSLKKDLDESVLAEVKKAQAQLNALFPS